jgi:hypothetical protein
MPTLVKDPAPAEFEALLERRRMLGQDLFDEVWDGVLHVNPAPHSRHGKVDGQLAALLYEPAREAGLVESGPMNLGDPGDFRVPDRALALAGPRRCVSPDRGCRGRDRLPGRPRGRSSISTRPTMWTSC